MNKKNTGKLTFTILSISLLTVMAGAAMAPALGVIREHFNNQSSLMVQLIVSLTALFIILTNFLFPAISRLMKTRTLAIVGLLMYIGFDAGAVHSQSGEQRRYWKNYYDIGLNNLYKFGNKCGLLPNLYYICIRFTTNMNGVKELILSFASYRKEFSTDELWDWISQNGDIVRNTVNITLSRLVSKGEIMKVSRGVYAMAKGKSIFRAVLEDREIQVAEILRNKYPFAPFCIYNGKSLVPLQHHLSENNVTYVETCRSAMEAVFNTLKDAGYEVWLNPSEDITYKYIDLRKPVIIVKPLVTEAPTEKINNINVPTIEKLLVDIKKDEDFAYLQGSEAQRMWEIGESLYNINQSRLKRYAKRRGLNYISAV